MQIARHAIYKSEYTGVTVGRFVRTFRARVEMRHLVTDWKPTDTSDNSRAGTIRTITFDEDAVDVVAGTLSAQQGLADFRLPSSRVWQVTVPGDGDRPTAMITMWPGIRRVDVVNGASTVVFSDVRTIDIVPGVEVQFRRGNRDCLIVARSGKIIVRV